MTGLIRCGVGNLRLTYGRKVGDTSTASAGDFKGIAGSLGWLVIADCGMRVADYRSPNHWSSHSDFDSFRSRSGSDQSAVRNPHSAIKWP